MPKELGVSWEAGAGGYLVGCVCNGGREVCGRERCRGVGMLCLCSVCLGILSRYLEVSSVWTDSW